MIDHARRLQLADELVRRITSAVRSMQLYASSHPLVDRNVTALVDACAQLHQAMQPITVGFIADEIVVGDLPLARPSASMIDLARRLRARGIERLTIEQGVTAGEIAGVGRFLAAPIGVHVADDDADTAAPDFPHVRIGRIAIAKRLEASAADMATIRRLYAEAVTAVETIWEDAARGHVIDAKAVQGIVRGLARAIAQNRNALLALTAVKNHDNYTFTHMVNVSILTMAQARTLGVDGPLLHEFGVAALMHDIGKVRIPVSIVQKPDKLTEDEFAIIRRHPVDGAQILRRTPDMPPLVPVVAFEHHLRLDGSGYPASARRATLNVATMLTSIADVYDAMRSQRVYQQSFPSDRVLEVLRRNDGRQFDQHLVRRFVQLLGLYPVGSTVRLDSGEVAIVLQVNPTDAHCPRVRVVRSPQGERFDPPYDLDLWTVTPHHGQPSSIAAPVDPDRLDIDPLACL